MSQYAPIVLFVYNRPDHTRRTVEALKNNPLAQESDLIVYSDAAKTNLQVMGVEEVRQYARKITGFRSVTIIERKTNWGLARSVIDGVTSVVNRYNSVIVVEDDLIVTPHFLEFMNHSLHKYESECRVVQISGYMFPVQLSINEDTLFLPLTTSWGWATWKRAWNLFDPEAKGYEELKRNPLLRKQFNLDGAYDYYSMLEAQLAGHIDSWAVRWQLSAFMNGLLTLYPRRSLVVNAGFDGSGTHGVMVGPLSHSNSIKSFSPKTFPKTFDVGESWQIICKFLKNRDQPTFLNRLVRRLLSLRLIFKSN